MNVRPSDGSIAANVLIGLLVLAVLFVQSGFTHLHLHHDTQPGDGAAGHFVDVHSLFVPVDHDHHDSAVALDLPAAAPVKKADSPAHPLLQVLALAPLLGLVPQTLIQPSWYSSLSAVGVHRDLLFLPPLRAPPR